jgi:hypothetical protein
MCSLNTRADVWCGAADPFQLDLSKWAERDAEIGEVAGGASQDVGHEDLAA